MNQWLAAFILNGKLAISPARWAPARAGAPIYRDDARRSDWVLPLVAYLVLSLASRAAVLGNPVVHPDEQFYLLVGDRMLGGALPYVDIWDRKPVGLFVLYAALRLLPGDGVLAYQLAAALSVALTALAIYRLARQIAAPAGAFFAGFAYILYLLVFECVGGQTPVFYNLPMVLAVMITLRAIERPNDPALVRRGLAAMALVGVAIQIKYSALFEGGAMGLALLWRALADRRAARFVALAGAAWIAAALVPTLLALLVYARLGHAGEFLDANFVSIFRRHDDWGPALVRLAEEAAALTGFWLAIFHAPRRLPMSGGTNPRSRRFLNWWCLGAVAGFLVFGAYYDHYVAPLLVPLAVLAAPALGRTGKAAWYTRLLIGFGMVGGAIVVGWNVQRFGNAAQVDRMTALIRDNVDAPGGNGCAYLYEGDPILYKTTGSCLVTRYAFQTHLVNASEADAIGTDTGTEIRRIMAHRPSVVTILVKPTTNHPNPRTRPYIERVLARDYRLVAVTPLGWRDYRVYRYAGSPAR